MDYLTNEQLELITVACDLQDPTNVFCTGRAGVGKSFTLNALRERFTKLGILHAVSAPTGVAAIKIGGTTIHNLIYTLSRVSSNSENKIDAVIIDEISMASARLIDDLDRHLKLFTGKRKTPFGGVKMIFMGDVAQLPPVVQSKSAEEEYLKDNYLTKYFFSSHAYAEANWKIIELTKVFRQTDQRFVKLLNMIRAGDTDIPMRVLNENLATDQVKGVLLTGSNRAADEMNLAILDSLPEEEVVVIGTKSGNFPDNDLPTMCALPLKIGARVMVIKNIYNGEGVLDLVNGDWGAITEFDYRTTDANDNEIMSATPVRVKIDCKRTGEIHSVPLVVWEKKEMVYDYKKKSLTESVIGTFYQFPLRLAWAITIHKSQGSTIEELTVDLRRPMFAAGQLYVALSRGVSLDKLHIIGKCRKQDIFTCPDVAAFLADYKAGVGVKTGGKYDPTVTLELFQSAIMPPLTTDKSAALEVSDKTLAEPKPIRLIDTPGSV